MSAVSSKYFKQLLKAEQQKFEKCNQRVNLNSFNMKVVPTVSSFNVTSYVKNVTPWLQTSVDVITPIAECSNILNQPIASNYCIPYIENCSTFQVVNDTPLSIENNATQNLSLSDKLRSLIVKYKISHNCCNSLLQILRSEGLEVPKDVRTLMKTPKNHEIVHISGGSYVHLGIKNMLLPFLSRHNAQVYITPHILKIGININGLPIAKSSKSQHVAQLLILKNYEIL